MHIFSGVATLLDVRHVFKTPFNLYIDVCHVVSPIIWAYFFIDTPKKAYCTSSLYGLLGFLLSFL